MIRLQKVCVCSCFVIHMRCENGELIMLVGSNQLCGDPNVQVCVCVCLTLTHKHFATFKNLIRGNSWWMTYLIDSLSCKSCAWRWRTAQFETLFLCSQENIGSCFFFLPLLSSTWLKSGLDMHTTTPLNSWWTHKHSYRNERQLEAGCNLVRAISCLAYAVKRGNKCLEERPYDCLAFT